jgi:hypothetical protein
MDYQCAKHYACALADPFTTPAGACVPQLPCLDSAKRVIFARGAGMIQSNGCGGISANTCLVGDQDCVTYTDGTGTSGDTMTGMTTVAKKNNSTLTSTQFSTNGIQARVVACGIRVKCVGPPLQMNGTVYPLEESSHLGTGSFDAPSIGGYAKVEPQDFNNEWVTALWQPVLPEEYQYSTDPFASPRSETHNPLVILIEAKSTSGDLLPFMWEYFLHYEAIGYAVQGKSRSHLATVEGGKVIAGLSSAPQSVFNAVSNGKLSAGGLADRVINTGSATPWSDLAYNLAGKAGKVASASAATYVSGGLAAMML